MNSKCWDCKAEIVNGSCRCQLEPKTLSRHEQEITDIQDLIMQSIGSAGKAHAALTMLQKYVDSLKDTKEEIEERISDEFKKYQASTRSILEDVKQENEWLRGCQKGQEEVISYMLAVLERIGSGEQPASEIAKKAIEWLDCE